MNKYPSRFLLFLFFLLLTLSLQAEPAILYLGWKGDPTTSMVVQWHTLKDDTSPTFVSYSKDGSSTWLSQEGTFKEIKDLRVAVHTVELTGLDPGASYRFRVGNDKKELLFRTLPDTLQRPLRVAIGGDAYDFLGKFKRMNRVIAAEDPDCVIVGGDIAYVYGRSLFFKAPKWRLKRWQTFLREWKKQMVGEGGRLIPLVAVIGNHDVQGRKGESEMFFDLFPFPEKEKAYRTLDIGEGVSFFLLDTGHKSSIEGAQMQWLEGALEEREDVAAKMAVYHIGAYPSVYPYAGKTPAKLRSTWCPLFEEYGIMAAFEHHNHAFKRTYPLKAGKIDPEGVVYLGDGCWGVRPRRLVSKASRWYLEKALRKNCFWMASIGKEGCFFEAFDRQGELLDELYLKNPR